MLDNWSQIKTWSVVLPPSRPDSWQLSVIAQHLTGIARNEPVGVLGSTPEFRDLLAELQFENIHVFERNEAFHYLVSKQRVYQNPEVIVWGDWLNTLSDTKNRYAAILSDLTSGNIDYINRAKFYSAIAKALHKDGLYLDRILTHSIPNERVDALCEKYDKLPLNLTNINYFSCEFLFCSELLSLCGRVDSTKFYKVLHERLQTQRLKRFLEFCPLITPSDCVWWYGRSWGDLANDYERNLDVIESIDEPATSPYTLRARLLISRRRDNS